METTAVSRAIGSAAAAGTAGRHAPGRALALHQHASAADAPQRPLVGRLERVQRLAVGLGDIVGRQDQASHHDHHALAAQARIDGHPECVARFLGPS